MLEHRGPILKHQTSTLSRSSDFAMQNAINSSNLGFGLIVILPQRRQAMVDLGLELGNERLLSDELAWGEAFF